uniref:BTB domain-containing protein n=1 Tax=Chromulina nebulosa TaxID=96789 RepID=A0A7S0SZ81_9STRA|mmetsp:Transcript_4304/g.3859  ORF Transcript_4304/g.3859 Transcript_4304/m.3859 type:complete len:341 (+) Transcript_4304:86-1108(+)
MTAPRQTSAIEFVVVPQEDLFLEGGVRKLFRVPKGTSYPCQMQKNQTFSCLFRHYAKHNGLRKEDLTFFFVDELQQEQTPETVHLMTQDEIWVHHKKKPENNKKKEINASLYTEHFRNILNDRMHSDVKFLVGVDKVEVCGHKAILSARSEYFNAMFRKGGLFESSQSQVEILTHSSSTFIKMMEFIYTNLIKDLDILDTSMIIDLIMIANEYIIDDLKTLCSGAASKLLNVENIVKFMLISSNHDVADLREACVKFVRNQRVALRQNVEFCHEIESAPELGLLLFDATLQDYDDYDSDNNNIGYKRPRISENPSVHDVIPSQSGSANMIQNGNVGSDGL